MLVETRKKEGKSFYKISLETKLIGFFLVIQLLELKLCIFSFLRMNFIQIEN